MDSKKNYAPWIFVLLLVATWSVAATDAIHLVSAALNIGARWAIAAFVLFVVLGFAGRGINGRWLGALIDTRNKISLSRLQITLWTVMVLSAYMTIVFHRLRMAPPDAALQVSFPKELILAMGISSASFAGSSLIKSNKKNKSIRIDAHVSPDAAEKRVEAAAKEFEAASNELNALVDKEAGYREQLPQAKTEEAKKVLQDSLDVCAERKPTMAAARVEKERALAQAKEELASIQKAQGLLHKNDDPTDARWTDLFRGEEIANYRLLDMAKVQMLFFTLVVVVTYGAAIVRLLGEASTLTDAETEFPPFSETLNALLGISHATYLSVKTVDHE